MKFKRQRLIVGQHLIRWIVEKNYMASRDVDLSVPDLPDGDLYDKEPERAKNLELSQIEDARKEIIEKMYTDLAGEMDGKVVKVASCKKGFIVVNPRILIDVKLGKTTLEREFGLEVKKQEVKKPERSSTPIGRH